MKISARNKIANTLRLRLLWMTPVLAFSFTIVSPRAFAQIDPATPMLTITEIRVEGNIEADPNLIIVSCGLQTGRSYTPTDFHESSARAVRQLWNIGIFSDIQIWGEQPSADEVVIIISVKERPSMDSVTFSGNDKLKRKDLMEVGRFIDGMSLGPSDIALAMERILEKYREEGYLRAEIDYEAIPASADSTSLDLVMNIDEGPKVGISDIVIMGNAVLTDRQIRAAMETGTGFLFFGRGKYDRRQVESDKELIRNRYAQTGYVDAAVVADSLGYSEDGRNMTLFLTISEGEQYILRTLTWAGVELFDQEEIDRVVTIEEGMPYNSAMIEETRFAVNGLYTEEGYVYSFVEVQRSWDPPYVDVVMSVMEGEPANVAHIFITGNKRTKEHVIRRELLLKPGDRFSSSLFTRSMREIMALNYFSDVQLDPPPAPTIDGDLDVSIKVAERPTGQAMMGAGWSERDGIVGNIGLQLPNLFGNGQELSFTWDFGRIRRTIMIGLTEPWLFNTPTLVGANVYRSDLFWNIFYKQRREGFGFRIGRRLKWPDDYFRINVGYRLEETTFYDFDENYNPSPTYDLRKWNWPVTNSSVAWTITRDSRDRPEFPTRGSMNSLRMEVAGGPFAALKIGGRPIGGEVGSREQYVKWDITQSFYFLTWSNVAMALKIRGGLVEGFSGWDQPGFVPFNVKYLPGGTSFDGQIRGYENRRVGPLDTDGLEIGGQSMLIFTLEYTFPLAQAQSLYGLVFADAGNSWLDLGDTDPFDLRRSVGFGLRMFTPMVGLIGFDFAYGFDHFENGRRKGRWIPHFQFGAQFY